MQTRCAQRSESHEAWPSGGPPRIGKRTVSQSGRVPVVKAQVTRDLPVRVFLSHSRKDAALVGRTRAALGIVDVTPFVLEDLEGSRTVRAARDEIEQAIAQTDMVFLLLTTNATATEYTKAWITHEVACASSRGKKLAIFQEPGVVPGMPVTYWSDVVVFSADPGHRPIQMQRVVKTLKPSAAPAAGVVGGALVGTILGPVGMIIGAIIGGAGGAASTPKPPPKLRCQKCGNVFRFWNPIGTVFYCPHCRIPIRFVAS